MLASASSRIMSPQLHVAPPPFSHIPHQVVTSARESEIYAEGSAATHVYQVISGTLRTAKLLADGRRQLGAFVFAGEWVGFDGGPRHFYAAEAVTEARLLSFTRRDLDRLMAHDQDIARMIQDVLCGTLASAHERIVSLGRKTAIERVAGFLIDVEGRIDVRGKNGFLLPMSRADMADYLGLTVETVSRTLGELRRRHVVALEDAHHLRIIDATLLSELAGEEARRYCA